MKAQKVKWGLHAWGQDGYDLYGISNLRYYVTDVSFAQVHVLCMVCDSLVPRPGDEGGYIGA